MIYIISPHSDDAVFSLGTFISECKVKITIISPLMGIPADAIGQNKHKTLRKEHIAACKFLWVDTEMGNFLDDVYNDQYREGVYDWLDSFSFTKDDDIYIPMGIHHPDHVLISEIMFKILQSKNIKHFYVYFELPYKVLYEDEAVNLFRALDAQYKIIADNNFGYSDEKEKAINYYFSQIQNDEIKEQLKSTEIIFEVTSD